MSEGVCVLISFLCKKMELFCSHNESTVSNFSIIIF